MTFLRRLQSFLSGCTLLSVTCFPSCLYKKESYYRCDACFTDQPALCDWSRSGDSTTGRWSEADGRAAAREALCGHLRTDRKASCPFDAGPECFSWLNGLAADSDRLQRECQAWPDEKFRMQCHLHEFCDIRIPIGAFH